MIRLVALACGLLSGVGFVISGLYDPGLLQALFSPSATWDASLGLGLICIVVFAGLILVLARARTAPVLGGAMDPVPGATGWIPIASAIAFGLGWGLSGYVPLTALVSAGAFSSGAPLFLISVLGGMIVCDVIAGGKRPKRGGRGSFG